MTNDENRHANTKMRDLFSSERPVSSLLEAVLVRPWMYTIGGTLEEVGAFLEGFYSGMAAHNRNPGAQAEAQRWFDFCIWAAAHIEGAAPGGWYHLFKALRQAYPEDAMAFARLAALYIAFREELTDVGTAD